jgi:SAM-dependent methyltransferase
MLKNHPGFVEGNYYDIYSCKTCHSQFIFEKEQPKTVYENIYSSDKTYGYERYYTFAKEIKSKKDPLKYLARSESTYYPVYDYLKDKKGLSVLEVGCGYGYLSYALDSEGFKVLGIDISSRAIDFAKKNFGAFFQTTQLDQLENITKEKFDVIIATEVLEHIVDPRNFIVKCKGFLKKNGCIIITTPNRDYFPAEYTWRTDLPPIHISWISNKGIKLLSEHLSLSASFTDFSNYYPATENKIIKFLLSRRKRTIKAKLKENGSPIEDYRKSLSLSHKCFAYIVHRVNVVRNFSNFLYNKFHGSDIALGVVLTIK